MATVPKSPSIPSDCGFPLFSPTPVSSFSLLSPLIKEYTTANLSLEYQKCSLEV